MIRIDQIKIEVCDDSVKRLETEICRILRINFIPKYKIVKKSIDARKKPTLFYVYSVDISDSGIRLSPKIKNARVYTPVEYRICTGKSCASAPVVVGMGPAGLFCAYLMCLSGIKPVIIDRGSDVDTRAKRVDEFFEGGRLDKECNVQFGEGGAGTFSDGKLNTLVNDKAGRSSFVLETFVKFGAPENILYDAKPHIGTDVLRSVIKNMRNAMIDMGATVYFDTKLTGIEPIDTSGSNDKVFSDSDIDNSLKKGTIMVHLEGKNGSMELVTDTLVLAIGHSANDTLNMLYEAGLRMEAKDFAVGLRVCHEQEKINFSQYGEKYYRSLPAASYKLTHNTDSGIGVYSFCMCPGGYVVNASSVDGHLAINGMSNNDRGGRFANSAIIMTVGRDDFPSAPGVPECMRGVAFKEELERKAYEVGNGAIPYESLGEFRAGVLSNGCECSHSPEPEADKSGANDGFGLSCEPKVKDGLVFTPDEAFRGKTGHAPVHEILPDKLNKAFLEGMESFGHRIKGFDDDDCIVAGIESRTSSPVRIPRDAEHMANIRGIYPCGEGAGYAGGIMSAAMDGMLIAEEIWKKL